MPAHVLTWWVRNEGGQPLFAHRLPVFKLDATGAPTSGDDDADLYAPLSLLLDATNDVAYACLDNAAGAAKWGAITDSSTRAAVKVVRCATTANGTLATAFDAGSVIDGITLATGDRILIKDQTPPVTSGTAGPSNATNATSSNTGGAGELAWTNLGNINASDDSRVLALGNGFTTADTERLKADTFGLAVPVGATIVGIQFAWERSSSGGTVSTLAVRAIKGGVVSATELSALPTWTGSDTVETVGGATNLCGETWTVADVNASNFGCSLRATVAAAATARVDTVTATVYYTEAGVGTGSPDNGVYVVQASGVPVRASDADSASELISAVVLVKRGTANANTLWANTDETLTLGTDRVDFGQL
jgi:hypothetical protein